MKRERPPADPRGGHVRLYWELVDSVAWRGLSWAERGLYIAMRRKLLAFNNGNIEATLGALKHAGITSSATLAKGLRALSVAGFIAKTRQGGVAWGNKVCSLYRFTDEAVFDQPKQNIKAMPATNDYRRFNTIAEVRATLKAAHEAARRAAPSDDTGLQSASRASSRPERKASVPDSINEVEAAAQLHKLKQADRLPTARKAA